MFCLQCGSYNPDNAAFCGLCGRKLDQGAGPPQVGAVNRPITPAPEVPMGGRQSIPGEYIPLAQEMPPAGRSPLGQGTPPMQDIVQTGYGMFQNYNPPASPPYPPPGSATPFPPPASPLYPSPGSATPFPPTAQPWGANTPISYPEQPPLRFTNEQAVQMPPTAPSAEMFGSAYPGQASFASPTYPDIAQAPAPSGYPPTQPTPPPVVQEPWYKTLAKPMPIWAFIVCIVAVAGLLVVLQLTGSDWAAGAMHLAIGAGIIAVVIALATVARTFSGMGAKTNPRRVFQFVSAGLSILLLLALCLVGLTQQSTIHGLQAHNLEGQQQWQSAVNEYQLAGEGAPASENIARVYNEWGEQFSAAQRYEDAFAKFNVVMNNYGSATSGVDRAQSDTIKAYLGWGQQAAQQHDYTAATSHYDALLQLSYCATTCQAQASALDATAYYNLAESQLAAQNYTDAINTFGIVMSRFPSSPEAQKLHGDLAKALFGQGQQQLTTSCPSAIPTYQQLSTQFGDTPEGQQAKTALAAPQPVKGRFTGVVPNSSSLSLQAALMQGLYVGIPDTQFYQLLNSSPTTGVNSDGSFSFKLLKQGTYDLVWGTNNVDGNSTFRYVSQGNTLTYIVTVGPLCAYDFGDINEDFPIAP